LDGEAKSAYVSEAPRVGAAMERAIDFAKKASDGKRTLRKSRSRKIACVKLRADALRSQRTPKKCLLDWLAALEPLDEEFPEIDDPPPEPVDF
jgi:hypothetical protein